LITYKKKFFVINTEKTKELKNKQRYREIGRYSFADYLEDYERPQYMLSYKKDEQKLISYLEEFFKEHANMPYKIRAAAPPPWPFIYFKP